MPKKSDLKLGTAVIYTVPDNHLTKTVRGTEETIGSVHHPELVQFAAIVGRVNDDGSADLMILPPNRDPKWVSAVEQGDDAGQFQPSAA